MTPHGKWDINGPRSNKPFISRSSMMRALKNSTTYQVSSKSVFYCIFYFQQYLDEIISEAVKNLDEENDIRSEHKVEQRRTIQETDIINALHKVNVTKNEEPMDIDTEII